MHTDQVEVKIRALIVDPNSGSPVLVLKDINSEDMVPIWIGACEANAIASAIENIAPQRPMTHDLLKNFITHIGLEVKRIVISELQDNTYFASIEILDVADNLSILDARPSDAIALALRCACPIVINKQIFIEQNQKTEEVKDAELDKFDREDDWPEIIGEGNDLAM